jgi:hypothetical protein
MALFLIGSNWNYVSDWPMREFYHLFTLMRTKKYGIAIYFLTSEGNSFVENISKQEVFSGNSCDLNGR